MTTTTTVQLVVERDPAGVTDISWECPTCRHRMTATWESARYDRLMGGEGEGSGYWTVKDHTDGQGTGPDIESGIVYDYSDLRQDVKDWAADHQCPDSGDTTDVSRTCAECGDDFYPVDWEEVCDPCTLDISGADPDHPPC